MRLFWSLVAVMILASAILVPLSGGDDGPVPLAEPGEPGPVLMTDPPMGRVGTATEPAGAAPTGSDRSADEPSTPATPATPAMDPSHAGDDGPPAAPTPTPAEATSAAPVPAADDVANDPADDEATRAPGTAPDAGSEPPATDRPGGTDDPGEPTGDVTGDVTGDGAGDGAGDEDPGEPRSFDLSGAGTKDDPYRVTWEMLLSASETYRPRDGLTDLPPHLETMDGSWVRIDGYYIFPMFAASFDEALVMLNQWDGCCIGVPPSVYDSIEVKFTDPISQKRGHFAPYGSFMGKLDIDPYIVNDWLIGLYLLEDASLRTDL